MWRERFQEAAFSALKGRRSSFARRTAEGGLSSHKILAKCPVASLASPAFPSIDAGETRSLYWIEGSFPGD